MEFIDRSDREGDITEYIAPPPPPQKKNIMGKQRKIVEELGKIYL